MVLKFSCDYCGLCCQNIGKIVQLKDFDRGNGVCKFLKENKCSIYKTRPEICRVEAMYKYFSPMSRKSFYELNAQACKTLKQKHNSNSKEKQCHYH